MGPAAVLGRLNIPPGRSSGPDMVALFAALVILGGYASDPAPFEVDFVRTVTLEVPGRARPLELRASFPDGKGLFPLIVFCHGLGGSKDNSDPLVRTWVGHGYVVLQPTFLDSFVYMTAEQRTDFLAGRFQGRLDWQSRPSDVEQIVDGLDEVVKQAPGLEGKIDRERMAVAGHSFGAHTSMLLAGVEPRTLTGHQSFRDPRFRAALLISPQGKGPQFDDASFQSLTGPAMVISGTLDTGAGQFRRDPVNRQDPFHLSPAGDKFLVWIEGAHHGFGGISGNVRYPGAGPDDPEMVTWVRDAGLAFFDAYVKDDPRAKDWLKGDALKDWSGGKATMERR